MSTLYVTDLDGTLLNEKAEISQKSKEVLQCLIEKGVLFTVATARSPATAINILKDIPIKIPIVLMTGAIVYDIEKRKILKTISLSSKAVNSICEILETTGQNAMAYSVTNSNLHVYHKDLTCKLEQLFVAPRLATPYKKFIKTDNYLKTLKDTQVIMFLLCIEDLEKARSVYNQLSEIEGVRCYFYPYEYSDEGYLLEIYDENCSKASSIEMIMQHCGANKIVSFGDNINDLPLFAVSDECYATQNGAKEAKNAATATIGANTDDSVALFIKQHSGM